MNEILENGLFYLAGVATPYLVWLMWWLWDTTTYRIAQHIRKANTPKAPKVVGHIDKVEENDQGVIVTGRIMDAETLKMIRAGSVSGLSIGLDKDATFIRKDDK